MSGHNPVRVEEVFHAAADMQGAEREDFLRLACGADAEMRRLVDSLLAADGDPASLQSPLPDSQLLLAVEQSLASSPIERDALDSGTESRLRIARAAAAMNWPLLSQSTSRRPEAFR
jgi:cytochrome c1